MNRADIERILDDENKILPSSGFEMSVMDAVRQEADRLPPLAFPWSRALPGMIALLAAFGVAIWKWSSVVFDERLREVFVVEIRSEIPWVIVAIAGTIVSVLLSLGLMRRRV